MLVELKKKHSGTYRYVQDEICTLKKFKVYCFDILQADFYVPCLYHLWGGRETQNTIKI